jgi:hypothetical protein
MLLSRAYAATHPYDVSLQDELQDSWQFTSIIKQELHINDITLPFNHTLSEPLHAWMR